MSVCPVVVPGKRDDLLWLYRFVGGHYLRNLAHSNILKSYRRQPVVEQSGNYFGFHGNRRVLIQEQFMSQAVAVAFTVTRCTPPQTHYCHLQCW